jgi:hypothetical protein
LRDDYKVEENSDPTTYQETGKSGDPMLMNTKN